jgi:hypothetical protein
MSFPNVSDIIATTLESRTHKIRNNVENNNALLHYVQKKGNVRTFDGGRLIYEELDFQENPNEGWYSGYDLLPVSAADVISAAEFTIKQCAVPVVVSGLEQLQNSSKEAVIDLMEGRIKVAERSMANLVSVGLYSDGTGYGSKQLTGLDAAVPVVNTSGTYGAIDRASWSFWQNQVQTGTATTASNVQTYMNTLWAKCVRGMDHPNVIIADNVMWGIYLGSLQAIQRFNSPKEAEAGFESLKYMQADFVLDGGIGGGATASTMYFLNTDFLHFRPHKKRNFVPLSPSRRFAINQDAEVTILAFAGNLTCSGAKFQGRFRNS